MIPWGNYNFPRSTNKIQFFNEISTSVKMIIHWVEEWVVRCGVGGVLVRGGVGVMC